MRDLTQTLDAVELRRIRALLAESQPDLDPDAMTQYPRMLYHAGFYEAQQAWVRETDERAKKLQMERMAALVKIVTNEDDEQDLLLDGWKREHVAFLPADQDPRIPVGREARIAARQGHLSKDEEIRRLRLRLAELTGEATLPPSTPKPTTTVRAALRKSHHKKKPAPPPPAPAVLEGATA